MLKGLSLELQIGTAQRLNADSLRGQLVNFMPGDGQSLCRRVQDLPSKVRNRMRRTA